ncbi:MAG TPA: FCD domain-containing protein [Solirubrobacteraceae bacterium]|jgi:DNA-binding FadR family transcriptional regulator|nr:FCD domain-containing protein [Solirubrobacteraceae bacterium]
MSSTPPTTAPADELRESRLHERAAIVLAADVIAGRLEPGEPFPSSEEIVGRFGFSRTVAREALQTLSMLGVVRVQHGKRTEVRPPEDWNVLTPVMQEAFRRENRLEPIWRDLYEFRKLIEPQAAAWMATRGSDRDVAQLAAIAAEMRVLSEDAGNARRVLAADRTFHELIAQGASNRVLAVISRSFWDAVSVIWLESHLTADELAKVAAQHQRIADTIASREPEAAAAAMEEHLLAASRMDVGQFGSGAQDEI